MSGYVAGAFMAGMFFTLLLSAIAIRLVLCARQRIQQMEAEVAALIDNFTELLERLQIILTTKEIPHE